VSEEKPFCKRITPAFLKQHLEEYREWVREPRYICKKCGRVARRSRDLCKPVPLEGSGGPSQSDE
jgi:ribosomal protein S27AE